MEEKIAIKIHTESLGDAICAIPTINKLSQMYGRPITVFNNCSNQTHKENSNWYNINQIQNPKEIIYDFTILN